MSQKYNIFLELKMLQKKNGEILFWGAKCVKLTIKSRSDDTLLTAGFNLRMGWETTISSKSRRDDTLLTAGFNLRMGTVTAISKSRSDDTWLTARFIDYILKVSSLRDFGLCMTA